MSDLRQFWKSSTVAKITSSDLGEISTLLRSQIVFGTGAFGLITSFIFNPELEYRPTAAFALTTVFLVLTWAAIKTVRAHNAVKVLSLSYIALLTLGFRLQLDAMGDAAPYWGAAVAVEILLASALVFGSRIEYVISSLIVLIGLYLGLPQSYFQTISVQLLVLLLSTSVMIGVLINKSVMDCVIELYAAREKYRILSATDPLTGLGNRREFMKNFHGKLQLVGNKTICFAMIDLDNFKQINDRYGHEMGDRVLVAFARYSQALFSQESIGRLGGEEFGILFEVDKERDATLAIERLLETTRTPSDEVIGFSFSAGIVRILAGDEQSTILRLADLGLYTAKENGKSRISLVSRVGTDVKEGFGTSDQTGPKHVCDIVQGSGRSSF